MSIRGVMGAAESLVTSVFGRVGDILSLAGDYLASEITRTPTADISADDVDEALLEIVADGTKVRKNSGGSEFQRRRLNLIEGTNVTLTVADDAGSNEVDVTIDAAGGGISDGDKGDITVSGSGATWTIDNDVVTYAKFQNVTDARLVGRNAGSAGDAQEITLGTNLSFSGTTLNATGGGAPDPHAASHQNGGSDEISVAGLSGLLADGQTPLAHAASHQSGGSDAIKLDDLAATDDNTDLNVSTAKHGLMSKLPGGTSTFYRGDGAFAAPTAEAAITFTLIEKDLGLLPLYSGTFDITGLAGLTPNKPVYIQQAVGPYTGKGDLADEAEMDQALVTAHVFDATTIRAYWTTPRATGPLMGNVKFQYTVGA